MSVFVLMKSLRSKKKSISESTKIKRFSINKNECKIKNEFEWELQVSRKHITRLSIRKKYFFWMGNSTLWWNVDIIILLVWYHWENDDSFHITRWFSFRPSDKFRCLPIIFCLINQGFRQPLLEFSLIYHLLFN